MRGASLPVNGSLLLILLVVIGAATTEGAKCVAGASSTGYIQLTSSTCLGPTDRNGLLAVCGAAFKVDISKRTVKMTPLEQATLTWCGPAEYDCEQASFPGKDQFFPCKGMKATGKIDGSNKQLAKLKMAANVPGFFSSLSVTGPKQLTLVTGFPYSFPQQGGPGPVPSCSYTYTVVKGCVMGISASPAPKCPLGWSIKEGKSGIKYCGPCFPGTTSNKRNAAKCTPCKKGSNMYGAVGCNTCFIRGKWDFSLKNPTFGPTKENCGARK